LAQQATTQTTKTRLSNLRTKHTATLDTLEKYKLLVESVEDYAIFLLDVDGYIQTWNKGAQKNKGYKPEEIIGKHFSIFYLPEDIRTEKPKRELVLAQRLGRVEDEDWRVRKDGSTFWANVVITALRDENGKLVGFAKVTRDLTERKANEDKLRANNMLLKKQQQELEDLNVSKDEFISLASHQLRTPATAVKQLLGMLVQGFAGDVDPDQLDYIIKAYEANERQIRIVENLLKVAQLDAGKVVLRIDKINTREYLQDIVEEFSNTIREKGQTIQLTISETVPEYIRADEDNFRMALGNLLDNASKYSYNEGQIAVNADCAETRLTVSITDNGVGIDKERHDELFKKFSRIPNKLSNKVGGSGLGLYWVKQIAQLHGGDITVSSAKKGTTFTVNVPLERSIA
jgi:PAS domain S-box-containing protein